MLAEAKAQLRAENKLLLAQITPQERDSKSVIIVKHILASSQFQSAKCVLLFSPRADEPNIQPLFADKNSGEKTIYLSAAKDLAIWESKKLILEKIYPEIDLIICPGLAFDQQGYRLGRGTGWYDKMLPRFVNAYKIGVCFSEQIYDSVPHTTFDQKVDQVFSD